MDPELQSIKPTSIKLTNSGTDKISPTYDFTSLANEFVKSKSSKGGGSYNEYGNILGNIMGLTGDIVGSMTNEHTVPTQYNNLSMDNQEINSIDNLMSKVNSTKRYTLDPSDYYESDDNQVLSILGSTMEGASSGSSAWSMALGAFTGFLGGLIDQDMKYQKGYDRYLKDSKRINTINDFNRKSNMTTASTLTARQLRNNAAMAAYGGPIGISLLPVGGAIDYMQNEELLSTLGETMTQDNNRRTSMPVFAFGGALGGYGGDWSNGLNFIKAGGTHGENPIGGVPMGVAQDGMPNLVEEGEVVWNDYVFSNRINVPRETMERLGIKGKDKMTFAEAVEKAQKYSAERPNDPIEKRSLEAVLASLMQKQEEIRQSKAEEEQFNEMEDMAAFAADGGPIHIAKNKRGTFTAAATKHGMGVQEFAGHVLANKDKYSSAMVKKAVFAHNSKSWNHADGGYLIGQTYDVSEQEYNRLKQLGYEIEVL